MRPIDADTLLKQLAKVAQRTNEDAVYTGNRDSGLTWDMAVEYIKNAPTIDSISIDTKQEEHEISYQKYFSVLQEMWFNKVLTDQQYYNIIDKLFIYWEHRKQEGEE